MHACDHGIFWLFVTEKIKIGKRMITDNIIIETYYFFSF